MMSLAAIASIASDAQTRNAVRGRSLNIAGRTGLNLSLLGVSVRVWGAEILVAGLNYFVLMNLIYQPRWGELVAHQVGMSTRIAVIFLFAYLLLRYANAYRTRDLVAIGTLWLLLTLVFEWAGSLLILRRPVDEILVGWHIEDGYMWPYVLVAYATANLLVGALLHPHRPGTGALQSAAA